MSDEDIAKPKNEIRFVCPLPIWRKIMSYAKAAEHEVSGLGTIEKRNGALYITDAFILKQTSGPVSAEIDPEAISELVTRKISEGDMEFPSKLRFQWHSHVDFATNHSAQDYETVLEYARSGAKYLLSLIVNKKEEYEAWFSTFDPIKIIGLKASVIIVDDQEMTKKCEEEVAELVESDVQAYQWDKDEKETGSDIQHRSAEEWKEFLEERNKNHKNRMKGNDLTSPLLDEDGFPAEEEINEEEEDKIWERYNAARGV